MALEMINSIKSPFLTYGLVPIVISITGHRDIPQEDEPRLFDAVTKALKEIADQTPYSQHVLLSALAEGADRIAARAALENSWILGVILPAPASIYEQDFVTEESRSEFHELHDKASWVETLPAKVTSPDAYREAGIRMARLSLFLLALWDGDETNVATGGTADIVNLFLREIPEPSRPGPADNYLPEARPVWHILTRRTRAPDRIPISKVGDMKKLAIEPDGTINRDSKCERWFAVMKRIDLFSSDGKSWLNDNSDLVAQLNEKDATLGLPPSAKFANALHVVSDKISMQTQRTRDLQMRWLFGLALAAIFCQQTYSGPAWFAGWLAAAFVFGLLATALLLKGGRARLEEQYLDYRALAEACRVQYSWKRAGVSACVADHFLRDQRDELEWLRQAVRTTELMPGSLPLDADRIKDVAEDWIDDQLNYFIGKTDKATSNDAQYRKWRIRAQWLFWSGIAVTGLLLLLHVFVVPNLSQDEQAELQWLIVVYGMLFGLSGMVEVYLDVKSFREQARTYRRMGIAMGVARRNLNVALENGDLNMAEDILMGAGRDALDENGSWLLLHRDRPPVVQLG